MEKTGNKSDFIKMNRYEKNTRSSEYNLTYRII